MTHPVTGIDHCFNLVDNLDQAKAAYKALGFTLSPRGTHSAQKGTANYTIMFPDDYFELLGILTSTVQNQPRRDMLTTMGQGLHARACRVESAERAAEDLAALGIATQGLGHFSRPVSLPDGTVGTAAFATVSFEPKSVPCGTVFMCEHKTRDTVWIDALLDHPNTACGIAAILAVSDTPDKDSARFAHLWADGEVSAQGGWHHVHTGPKSAPVILARQDVFTQAYPNFDITQTATGAFTALRIKVGDLAIARDCLTHSNVRNYDTELGLAVAPEDAAGVIMEFVPT